MPLESREGEPSLPNKAQLPLTVPTQRLEGSSFLVMTYSLIRDYNRLPKKELNLSLWVIGLVGLPWLPFPGLSLGPQGPTI